MSEITIAPEVQQGLAVLQTRAQSITVADAETCREAKIIQRDVREYMKDVHRKLDPFVDSAKKNLQEARDEMARWIDPAAMIDGALAQKVKDYEKAERAAAEAEAEAINKKRRKQGLEEIEVAPSIPTVAGVPSRRNYKARVVDPKKVPDEWWVIDEQALCAEARRVKQVGTFIPGVEFYEV